MGHENGMVGAKLPRHFLSWVLGLTCFACSDGTALQLDRGEYVAFVAGASVRLVELNSAGIRYEIPLSGQVEGIAFDGSPGKLWIALDMIGSARELVSVDLCRRSVEPRLALYGPGGPNVVDGIGLSTGEVMVTRPGGQAGQLLMWRSWRGDTLGIAALDLGATRPVAFSGPWNVAAAGLIPMWTGSPDEALGVLASRQTDNPRIGTKLYLLDPGSFAVTDSINSSDVGQTGEIWSAAPFPDGRTLLLGGDGWLATYDMVGRTLLDSAARPSLGSVGLAPDGELVLLTDQGIWPHSAGSGLLHVFDRELSPVGAIDVSSPLGGLPGASTATVTSSIVFADAATAYVVAGTPAIGPLYPTQVARVLVVDVVARAVVDVLEVGGHDLGAAVPLACD